MNLNALPPADPTDWEAEKERVLSDIRQHPEWSESEDEILAAARAGVGQQVLNDFSVVHAELSYRRAEAVTENAETLRRAVADLKAGAPPDVVLERVERGFRQIDVIDALLRKWTPVVNEQEREVALLRKRVDEAVAARRSLELSRLHFWGSAK